MNSTDLQINDWVDLSEVDGEAIPCRIVELLYDSVLEKQPHDTACDDVWYDMIRPLQLSGQILENNGWELKSGVWAYKKSPIRIGWNPKNKKFYLLYGELPYPVEFVHQVQHILRVCGINDRADNFVV